jgi:hypothetical protein
MRKLLVALSLVLATVGSSAAETAEEIVAWYNGCSQLWRDANNVDIDAVAGYFASPRYAVGADGVAQLLATKEMNRARQAAGVENLKQRVWTYLAAKTKDGWKFLSAHIGSCEAPRSLEIDQTREKAEWLMPFVSWSTQ